MTYKVAHMEILFLRVHESHRVKEVKVVQGICVFTTLLRTIKVNVVVYL